MLFVATALWLAYEVPGIGNSGQTLGKRMMRIKVVAVESTDRSASGGRSAAGPGSACGRRSGAATGFGLLMQLIDSLSPLFDQKLRQALHDKTARTVVVALPPGIRPSPSTPARGGDASEGEK